MALLAWFLRHHAKRSWGKFLRNAHKSSNYLIAEFDQHFIVTIGEAQPEGHFCHLSHSVTTASHGTQSNSPRGEIKRIKISGQYGGVCICIIDETGGQMDRGQHASVRQEAFNQSEHMT